MVALIIQLISGAVDCCRAVPRHQRPLLSLVRRVPGLTCHRYFLAWVVVALESLW